MVYIPASTSLLFVQSLSHVWLFAVPWAIACQAYSLPKFMAIESVMLSPMMISPSAALFSSHLQSFPASETLPMSQFFTSDGQSTGVSASASVLSMRTQGWFLLGWTGLLSLLPKGVSRVFSSTTIQKHQFFGTQPCLWSNFHIHTWQLEKL